MFKKLSIIIAIAIAVLADMKILISAIYRYRPIRKRELSALYRYRPIWNKAYRSTADFIKLIFIFWISGRAADDDDAQRYVCLKWRLPILMLSLSLSNHNGFRAGFLSRKKLILINYILLKPFWVCIFIMEICDAAVLCLER